VIVHGRGHFAIRCPALIGLARCIANDRVARPPTRRPGLAGRYAAAQRATVSQVRVVISSPKARSMSRMNTGPLPMGT